jgi:hypothetical protein
MWCSPGQARSFWVFGTSESSKRSGAGAGRHAIIHEDRYDLALARVNEDASILNYVESLKYTRLAESHRYSTTTGT